MRCLIMFGSPGSGKGTQSQLLSSHNMTHISTGDILRNSIVGQKFLKENPGKLAPDELMDGIVQDNIHGMMVRSDNPDFILDGYPRTVPQANVLHDFLEEFHIPIVLIFLQVPRWQVEARMLMRGREDDLPSVIDQRFIEYTTKTLPVLERLRELGHPYLEVDASGATDTISVEIQALLKGTNAHNSQNLSKV